MCTHGNQSCYIYIKIIQVYSTVQKIKNKKKKQFGYIYSINHMANVMTSNHLGFNPGAVHTALN